MRHMKHKEERVIYIEYHDKIPHCAITVNKNGFMQNYDFEIFHGEKKDIRYYNSGSGGHMTEIQPPTYIDGCKGTTYWMDEDASFSGKPQNITKISKPFRLKGYCGTSINPFSERVSEETDSMDYCDRCDHWSNEYCRIHQFEDENDDYTLKYIDDNTLAE